MRLSGTACRAKVDHTYEVPGTRPVPKDTRPLALNQGTPENNCLLGHGASLSAACQRPGTFILRLLLWQPTNAGRRNDSSCN